MIDFSNGTNPYFIKYFIPLNDEMLYICLTNLEESFQVPNIPHNYDKLIRDMEKQVLEAYKKVKTLKSAIKWVYGPFIIASILRIINLIIFYNLEGDLKSLLFDLISLLLSFLVCLKVYDSSTKKIRIRIKEIEKYKYFIDHKDSLDFDSETILNGFTVPYDINTLAIVGTSNDELVKLEQKPQNKKLTKELEENKEIAV